MSRPWRLPGVGTNTPGGAGGGRGGRRFLSANGGWVVEPLDLISGSSWEEASPPEAAADGVDSVPQPHFRGLARRLSNYAPRSEQDLPAPEDAERALTQCTRDFTWRTLQRNFTTCRPGDPSESEVEFCRICREGRGRELLIAPCDCRGTVRFVHKSCLERWLAESDTSFCEICGIRYVTERTPRYGLLKSVLLWALTARQDLLIDLLTFLTFMPLAVLGTTMGVSASRSLCYGLISEPDDEGVSNLVLLVEPHMGPIASQVCTALACVGAQTMTAAMVAVMAAMDIAVSAWLVLRVQQHATRYYSWWRRNCMVRLVLPPPPPPTPPPADGQDSFHEEAEVVSLDDTSDTSNSQDEFSDPPVSEAVQVPSRRTPSEEI